MDLLNKEPQSVHALQTRIAEHFKMLRIDIYNMTREQLARMAGVSRSTISRLEAGGDTSLSNLLSLAVALNAEEAFLELFKAPPVENIADVQNRKKLRRRASGK